MPSTEFIIIAAAMVIAALTLIVVPLTRGGDRSPLAAGVVVALLPLSAALLYFSYSNWQWDIPPDAPRVAADSQIPSVDEMVVRLEQRLQSNPEDAEGWQMLGRSYVVLSRYPEAVEAYNQARQLSGDTDVNAITGYAEALAMIRGGMVDQESAALFEKALQLAPDDRKALWYGGMAAFERGQAGIARSRWQALLKLNPPEQMAQVLHEQIAAADVMLGDTPAVAENPVMPAATQPAAGVALTVSLAPELTRRLAPDAPLFILARQVDTPGPPLAVVRRRAADLPIQVVLSDADAMVAGRVLSAHSSVEVVARVALGGTPNAQPGDLSGSKIVSSNGVADIVIDTIVGN